MQTAARTSDLSIAFSQQRIPLPAHRQPSAGAHAKWRVLVVDDHAMVREMVRLILESYAEIEVVAEAADGDESILQAEEHRPDLVILDVNLPGRNGIDACRRIKQLVPQTVVLGISADFTTHNYTAMIAAGAVAFVRKEEAADLLFRTIVYAMFTYGPGGRNELPTALSLGEEPFWSAASRTSPVVGA